MDLTALYPSIIRAFNIALSTMLFKIKYTEFKKVDSIIGYFDCTRDFMEKYISNDPINYCIDYHNQLSIEDMSNEIDKRLLE